MQIKFEIYFVILNNSAQQVQSNHTGQQLVVRYLTKTCLGIGQAFRLVGSTNFRLFTTINIFSFKVSFNFQITKCWDQAIFQTIIRRLSKKNTSFQLKKTIIKLFSRRHINLHEGEQKVSKKKWNTFYYVAGFHFSVTPCIFRSIVETFAQNNEQ